MSSLVLVGLPIGNYEDCSIRVINFLKQVPLIICEDTRVTKHLLLSLGIECETISYISAKETAFRKASKLIAHGKDVAFVSDRGMPCISDPGAKAVEHFRSLNIKVECLPGPSALTVAIALTGYSGGFIFHGFLPRKKSEILKVANMLGSMPYHIVFFEAPFRMKKTLELLSTIFEGREITIARELTKTYEEIIQGKIEDIAKRDFQGECVLIIKAHAGN
jgi:16S rRNA (cytidine1402-2'-O)-methyltransferase